MNRLPFDGDAIAAIAGELGVPATEAPYRVGGATVYELRVPVTAIPGAVLLVGLWPSIARVDVRMLGSVDGRPLLALTGKQVTAVEIYPGVEVMFRRDSGRVFFVTARGEAAMAD